MQLNAAVPGLIKSVLGVGGGEKKTCLNLDLGGKCILAQTDSVYSLKRMPNQPSGCPDRQTHKGGFRSGLTLSVKRNYL